MTVGVIIALDREYQRLTELLGGSEGVVAGNHIVLRHSGVGKVNAALGTQRLINECNPDCIINNGVAGGLDASLHVMDVVVSKELVYHDVWCGDDNAKGQIQGLPERFKGDERLLKIATGLDCGHPIYAGLICTGDQFVTNDSHLHEIKSNFPDGLAVDMESAAIAQTCYLNNVPFLAVRFISDVPSEAKDYEEHVAMYNAFWANVSQRSFRTGRMFLESLPNQL